MQTLLVAPQHNEVDYLLEGFRSEGYNTESVLLGSIEGATIRALEITVATGGHGKAQFAAQTQYLISHLPAVDLVICAGASGSLVNSLSIGDVIVGTNTIELDYHLRFAGKPLPVHAGHSQSIGQLQEVTRSTHFPFDIHFGRIASGDEDIIDRERARELHAKTNALCFAWEGSVGARAV
jgi:adenosylhomocysteine nucleosidase